MIRIFGIALVLIIALGCSTAKRKCEAYGNGKYYKK